MRKRFVALLLTLCMVFTLAPSAFAADIRTMADFYLKQQTSSTCTLSSAAMMLRRRAYLDGVDDWGNITEGSLRRVAWSYVGLSHDFTYDGITVLHDAFATGLSVESQLTALLKEHPEGIVVYNRHVPHAILVTDYTGGTFYCADPSSAAPGGRVPVDAATISISNANFYWYVAADTNRAMNADSALEAANITYPTKLKTGSDFSPTGTLTSPGTITAVNLYILNSSNTVVQTATVEPNTPSYDLAGLAGLVPFSTLAGGSYTYYLTADDDLGGHISLRKPLSVTNAETVTAQYSGTVPRLANINAVNLTETGFDVEADAYKTAGGVTSVLFSAWADGNQFTQGLVGSRNGDTYTVHIDAASVQLGINTFMINITAMDADGNSAKGTLLIKVSADDTDVTIDSHLTADQRLL
ncbi:MAG: hypothetical protein PHO10_03745 [Gemmiger sp.]|nr:hypothetical protein [Gemmiger sp.]